MKGFSVVSVDVEPKITDAAGRQVYVKCVLCTHRHSNLKFYIPMYPTMFVLVEREFRCPICGCEHERILLPQESVEVKGA